MHGEMLALIGRVIVSEKMKHAMHQQPTHLAIVRAAPAERLAQSGCGRDDDLTQEGRSTLAFAAVLEAQHVGSVIPSAKPPVQIPYRPFTHQDDGNLARLCAKGAEDSGTE